MDRNARNITREFVEVLNAVILDEALGQNADRLWNVDKRRVRLRRDRSTVGIDASAQAGGQLPADTQDARTGTAGATAKGQRAWSLQDFDALRIVNGRIEAAAHHIVAKAVDEKIRT